jgi:hypothetical protein
MFIDYHDAADLLLVHQRHGFTQGRFRRAGHRVTHGQFAQAGVERILGAEGFHGFLLDLLIDLIQQAAHAAQGKVAKAAGNGEELDERQLVQLQAKGVFGRQVFGAGRAFAQQRGEGKALAGGDFERGFGPAFGRMWTFADDPALFDDVKCSKPGRRRA